MNPASLNGVFKNSVQSYGVSIDRSLVGFSAKRCSALLIEFYQVLIGDIANVSFSEEIFVCSVPHN
jgi:hypothetical protein